MADNEGPANPDGWPTSAPEHPAESEDLTVLEDAAGTGTGTGSGSPAGTGAGARQQVTVLKDQGPAAAPGHLQTSWDQVQAGILTARERARRDLAFSILVLVAVLIVFGFVSLWFNRPGLDDLLKTLFPPVAALAAAAIAFYFASDK